jgi:hypothetical protein
MGHSTQHRSEALDMIVAAASPSSDRPYDASNLGCGNSSGGFSCQGSGSCHAVAVNIQGCGQLGGDDLVAQTHGKERNAKRFNKRERGNTLVHANNTHEFNKAHRGGAKDSQSSCALCSPQQRLSQTAKLVPGTTTRQAISTQHPCYSSCAPFASWH